MYKSLSAVCILLTCLFFSVCRSDEWSMPTPRIYAAEDGSIALKVLPGPITGKKRVSRATLFRLNRAGSEVILKQFSLINIPEKVLVPEATVPYFVTLDSWGHMGYQHTLVIYQTNGKIVRDLRLEDLLTEKEIDDVEHSEGSRWWREEATFTFEIPTTTKTTEDEDKDVTVTYVTSYPKQARLNIQMPWGKKIKIRLSTGKVLP